MYSQSAVVMLSKIKFVRLTGWVEVVVAVDLLDTYVTNGRVGVLEVFLHLSGCLFMIRNSRVRILVENSLDEFFAHRRCATVFVL